MTELPLSLDHVDNRGPDPARQTAGGGLRYCHGQCGAQHGRSSVPPPRPYVSSGQRNIHVTTTWKVAQLIANDGRGSWTDIPSIETSRGTLKRPHRREPRDRSHLITNISTEDSLVESLTAERPIEGNPTTMPAVSAEPPGVSLSCNEPRPRVFQVMSLTHTKSPTISGARMMPELSLCSGACRRPSKPVTN